MGTKVMSVKDAIEALVGDRSTVAIGGMHGHNNPMALVRELVRQQREIHRLILGPSASLNADLLFGRGLVKEVQAPYIGFENIGLAPLFKWAVEKGVLKVRECETSMIINGLRAGAAGVPLIPVAPSVENTSIPSLNKEDYRWVTDPFTGSQVLCTPAINPDVALVHCPVADIEGNAIFGGCVFSDWDMIRASDKVILMVEKVLEKVVDGPSELTKALGISRPGLRLVPGMFVDAVVEAPFGCHPTSSHGNYLYDEPHLRMYIDMVRTAEGLEGYMQRYVKGPRTQEAYLHVLKEDDPEIEARLRLRTGTRSKAREKGDGPDGPTVTEVMVHALAQELGGHDTAIMGANSSIPMLACMFAKATHAPDLTFLVGGSGGINPRPEPIPSSSCDESLLTSSTFLELGDLIDAQVRKGAEVFFAGGLQVDRNGNLNLIGLGHKEGDERYRLRGPGTAGLSLLDNSDRIVVYLTRHTPKQLVERVEYVSGPGRPVNNVSKVVTPLCVFDFDDHDLMTLSTLHPGVGLEEVVSRTGFPIAEDREYGPTPLPTKEDLLVIRGLDPLGTIRHRL